MKSWKLIIALVALTSLIAATALAKCYRFSKGGQVQVCVKGDSFADRKKAKKVCDKVKKSDCGNVSSYSSSCHSSTKQCFDEKGHAHQSLSGF